MTARYLAILCRRFLSIPLRERRERRSDRDVTFPFLTSIYTVKLSEIFTFPLLRHIENVIKSLLMKLTCLVPTFWYKRNSKMKSSLIINVYVHHGVTRKWNQESMLYSVMLVTIGNIAFKLVFSLHFSQNASTTLNLACFQLGYLLYRFRV
jgi:hypothetical protein